jgi:RNA polymerase sigma factor (sigma-70 family)
VSSNRERLSLLFDTHEDKLYRLARRLTASPEEAEDLLQDTFVKAAKAASSIPVGSPHEEAWLTRVLVNVRRDQWRKAGVRKRAAPLLQADVAAAGSTPESALLTKRAVWAALDALSPRRRAIVILSELDGLTPDAIAARLGVAVMTVRWHLSLARRELRRTLAPHMERSA